MPGATLRQSSISPGCIIEGHVERSILSPGVTVERGAVIRDSVIMHDTVVRRGARVERSIIDKQVIVGRNASLGSGEPSITNKAFPEQLHSGLTVIGKRAVVPDGARIGTNCIVYPSATRGDYREMVVGDGETVRSSEPD